jgi:DNA-binding XRE family transcriptional regulator
MAFGEKLLDFRAKYNLTQIQVADIIGVSNEMICFYEKGKYKPHPKNKIRFEKKMKEWEENQDV